MTSKGTWILRIAAVLAAVAAVAAVLIGDVATSAKPVRFDAATFCPRDMPLQWSAIAIVDPTDPLSDLHLASIRAGLKKLRQSAPVGGQIAIFMVDKTRPFEGTELLRLCNPGRGSDGNRYIAESEMQAQRRWERDFERPFEELIARLRTVPASPDSPILETVTGIAMRPDFTSRIGTRVLYLASDGLQHREGQFTHYIRGDRWKLYKAAETNLGQRPDLSGVQVVFDYLARFGDKERAFQNAGHRIWWQQWFAHVGVTDLEINGQKIAAGKQL
ncbi:MAG: hypothetical protein ACOY4O_16695 [Pseudomonadota bacterium]